MPNQLDRRLRQLEGASPAHREVYVWRDVDKTEAEALATRFPDGVPAGVQPVVVGWLPPQP
jgi:hypothetical protein